MKLNMPPVKPIRRDGASADTKDQVIEARPLPKKAIDMKVMTSAVLSVKIAPIMLMESNSPVMIGSLREVPRLTPRLSMRSERTPLISTPANAAMNGSDVRNPVLM
ncbi:hypothetical protein D3C74_266470 [compost metagenome]